MRHDLPQLVEQLAGIAGHRRHRADDQRHPAGRAGRSAASDAGLQRLNISLDTLERRDVSADLPPRRARPRAGRHRRRAAGRLREDPAQRRGDSRHHRSRRSCRWRSSPASTAWNCDSSSSCRSTPTEHWDNDQVLAGEEIRRMLEDGIRPARARCPSPIPASRRSTFASPTAAAASASSIPSRSRFAATAIACGSRPKGRSATACSRPSSGTPARCCAAAARDDELAELVRGQRRRQEGRPRHRQRPSSSSPSGPCTRSAAELAAAGSP